MKGMFNMGKKYVYLFSEGNAQMRDILGGKGANLAEMTNIGLPVPQGFTVSTEACTRYYEDGGIIAQDILDEIAQYVSKTEEITGKKFGRPGEPAACVRPQRLTRVDARDDGHHLKPWPES